MIMEFGDRSQHSHSIFLCFTSTASSSSTLSMRIPSTKSFPSPGRLDQSVLSASRSRRLRNSGSLKGAQSPGLFASVVGGGSRKKNGSFETVEPSSPKVSCIGQVRVKTGRKKKKAAVVMRSRSRRVVSGEMSFRRRDHRGGEEIEGFPNRNQNQKWVHLPLESLCEAVKAFGSEINCFSPCGGGGGMCSSGSEKEKVGKRARRSGIGSCGTTFARCLLAIEEEHEEDNGKSDNVGIIDDGIMAKDFNTSGERMGSRREAMREVELVADELQRRGFVEEIGTKVENVDVPVCIPPKNALLLMRCRSDPVRMSELATRFGSFPVAKVEIEEGNLRHDDEKEEASGNGGEEESEVEHVGDDSAREPDSATSTLLIRDASEKYQFGHEDVVGVDVVEAIDDKGETFLCVEKTEGIVEDKEKLLQEEEGNSKVKDQDLKEKEKANEEEQAITLEENFDAEKQGMVISGESEQQNVEEEKENIDAQSPSNVEQTKESKFGEEKKSRMISAMEKEERRWSFSKDRRRHSFSTQKDVKRSSSYKEKEAKRSSFSSEREARRFSFSSEMEFRRKRRSFSSEKQGRRDATLQEKLAEDAEKEKNGETQKPIEAEKEAKQKRTVEETKELPDCLLMMMYEPKLSMEVSKETWVCKADFVRPHRSRPCQNQLQQPNMPKPDEVSTLAMEEMKKEKEPTTMTDMKSVPQPLPLLPPPPSHPLELVKQVEQKHGNAGFSVPSATYGPFILTRCKSEPMRSSAKMLPDTCFWKNRHQPISTAGIGF